MAQLNFSARWFEGLAPTWLGNDKQDKPFRVRIRRISKGELGAFRDRFRALVQKGVATVDELEGLFGGIVEGPFGELVITLEDGPRAVREGDLRGLLEIAELEHLVVGEPLAGELAAMVGALNSLNDEAEGKSEPPPGGSGTADGGSPSPRQQDAAPAAP